MAKLNKWNDILNATSSALGGKKRSKKDDFDPFDIFPDWFKTPLENKAENDRQTNKQKDDNDPYELKEGIVFGCLDGHFAVFALLSGNDSAAQDLAHQLHAVADSENGDAKLEDTFVYRGGVFFEDGVRSAGKDDAFGRGFFELFGCRLKGNDLSVNFLLADAAGYQLGVLGTVV